MHEPNIGLAPITPARHSIQRAAALLGISRATIYLRIKEGKIRTHKDGSRAFIGNEEISRYLRACEAGQ